MLNALEMLQSYEHEGLKLEVAAVKPAEGTPRHEEATQRDSTASSDEKD